MLPRVDFVVVVVVAAAAAPAAGSAPAAPSLAAHVAGTATVAFAAALTLQVCFLFCCHCLLSEIIATVLFLRLPPLLAIVTGLSLEKP